MSRRTTSSGQTVSLFPFLAVLVCVMGSLIFLLLATTKRLRDIAVAEAAAQQAARQPAPIEPVAVPSDEPSIPYPQPELGTPTSPISVELAEAPPTEPDPAELQRRREQQALEREWHDKLTALQARRKQLHEQLQQQLRAEQLARTGLAELDESIGDAETRLRGVLAQIEDLKPSATAAADIAALEAEIIELRKKLRLLRNRPTEGHTKYAVIPFDARSGTTRRPILIECTADGLRFVSEDIVIKPSDLEGFTDRYNPLLAGSAALIQYWNAWNRKQPHPEQEQEPYVLLIVRPDGTLGYYVAMQMLSTLRQPFGYELVEESVQLQPPPTDDRAQEICRAAIERMLAERSNVIAHARSGFRSHKGAANKGATGNGAASNGTAGSGRSNSQTDTFQLSDVLPPSDEVGERSWEKPERYEGRRADNAGRSQRRWFDGDPLQQGAGTTGERSDSPSTNGDLAESAERKPPNGEPSETPDGSATGSGNASDLNSPGNPPRLLPNEDPAQQAAAKLAQERQGRQRGQGQRGGSPQPGDLNLQHLARRHWGDSDAAAKIGIEQDVKVRIDSRQLLIAESHSIRYDASDPPLEVFLKLMNAVDAEARTWGKPRPGFYWTPRLKFVISPGGNQMFERIDPLMVRSGLSASRDFTLQAVRPIAEEVIP